jgi:hypothetical protein
MPINEFFEHVAEHPADVDGTFGASHRPVVKVIEEGRRRSLSSRR